MKKTLSLILALLMSVSCASTIFAADDAAIADEPVATSEAVEEAVDETPAEAATPYDRAIKFLNTYNIMHGKEDGLLHAEQTVKRYEMALFTGRIMSGWVDDDKWEDFDANDSGFTDLKGTGAENVYGAMSYVSQKGVIEGYGNGIFKPEQTVTYREALTMAVRTLGYGAGYDWPWDYIEKAVNLGITDGIEGVAYTDPCNRGVAAQIIYNTLFAENSKLGLANFDGAFAWSDIVITATESAKATTAKYDMRKGYVAFQVVEEDGTLSKEIYYAKASELGLDLEADKHADEIALGTPYAVLFQQDGEDNLVKIVDYDKYEANTIQNAGITDNDGVAYTDVDPIGTYLDDKKIVDAYSNRILSNEKHDDNEIIITTAAAKSVVVDFDYNKSPYAFDWENQNILIAKKDDKGNYIKTEVTDSNKPYTFKEGDKKYNYEYQVAWYYEPVSKYYFQVKLGEKGEYVGVLKMEQDDVDAMREVIAKAAEIKEDKLVYVPFDGKTALHSNLDVYTTTEGLRGIYEGYGFGEMKQETKWIDNANHETITIGGNVVADITAGAWWQDDYAPALDKDGKVVRNYVIYGYNKATKEFKVIKTIEALSDKLVDADTYYTTGVVKGYSLKSDPYVVINDTKFDLSQNYGTFKFDTDDDRYKNNGYKEHLTTAYLEPLFMQFVTYYVLDGEVVALEAKDAGHKGYIVADSYAGISNDNYLVVNGYSTEDLKYDRFRIGSYDHWNEGDFFWYGSQIADQFIKGQVYKVLSYDKDNDVYYVETLGEVDSVKNPTKFEYEGGHKVEITFDSGYRLFNDKSVKDYEVEPRKTSSSDKYILIPESTPTAKYMPIIVYEGRVTSNDWWVNGIALGCDKNSKTFVIANADMEGFVSNEYWKNSGLALVVKKQIMEKFYDGAGLDADQWYLNGATETAETLVFNFYTGEFEYAASALNKNLKVGTIYRMIDGVITEAIEQQNWAYLWTEFIDTYTNLSKADHAVNGTGNNAGRWYRFVQNIVVTEAYCDGKKDDFSKEVVSGALGLGVKVKGLVSDLKVVKLVKDDDKEVYSVESVNKDAFKKLVKDTEDGTLISGDLILKSNGDGTYAAVIYIDPDDCVIIKEDDEKVTVDSTDAIQWKPDLATGATVEATKTTTSDLVNGNKVYDYTIDSIGFNLFGSYTKEDHATLRDNEAYFDNIDRCTSADGINLANWNAEVKVIDPADYDGAFAAPGRLYETDIDFETYKYHKDITDTNSYENCKLVQGFSFNPATVNYDGVKKSIVVNSVANAGIENGIIVGVTATLKDGANQTEILHSIILYVIDSGDHKGELAVAFYDDYEAQMVDGNACEDNITAVANVH